MRKTIQTILIALFVGAVTSFSYHHFRSDEINYFKGRRLFEEAEYEQAIPFYRRSIELGASGVEPYRDLAYSYLWSEQSEKAISILEMLSEKAPEDPYVKEALAEAYAWSGYNDKAIEIYREIMLDSADLRPKIKLAELYLWSGRQKDALVFLRPLIEFYPEDRRLKTLWGRALYYAGESEKASRVFEELLGRNDETQ